jgi:hypothetical protein
MPKYALQTFFYRSIVGQLLWILIACLNFGTIYGQCDKRVAECKSLIGPFEWQSKSYHRSELFPLESTRMNVTLHFDKVYRFIPCGVADNGDRLSFQIYDKSGVPVFHSNKTEPHAFYDFAVGVSGRYTIVSKFESGAGCAALLLGTLDKDKAQSTPGLKVIDLKH